MKNSPEQKTCFSVLLINDWQHEKDRARIEQILTELRDLGHRVMFATPQLDEPERFHVDDIDVVRRSEARSLNQFFDVHGEALDLVILSRLDVAAQNLYAVRRKASQAYVVFDAADLAFLHREQEAETHNDAAMRKKAAAEKKMELALMRAVEQTWVALPDSFTMLAHTLPDTNIALLPLASDVATQTLAQETIQETLRLLQH